MNRIKETTMLLLGLLIAATATIQAAEVPKLMNYQGKLSDANGDPLATGEYTLTFKIWDHATETGAAHIVWTESHESVPVVRGLFNVILGGMSAGTFSEVDRFISIKVGDGNDIMPRQQLLSAPYALRAEVASQTASASLSGGEIQNDTISAITLVISETWCSDSGNTHAIHAPEMKKSMSIWSEMDGGGGLVFQAGEANTPNSQTMIYIFAISDSTGALASDYMFSTTPEPEVLADGYNKKRLLGARLWLGTEWVKFLTTGKGSEKWVHYDRPRLVEGQETSDIWLLGDTKDNSDRDWVLPPSTSRMGEMTFRHNRTSAGGFIRLRLRIPGASDVGDEGTNNDLISAASPDGIYELTGRTLFHVDSEGQFEYQLSGAGGAVSTAIYVVRYLESL